MGFGNCPRSIPDPIRLGVETRRDRPQVEDAAFLVSLRRVRHLGTPPKQIGDRYSVGLEVRGDEDAEQQEGHGKYGGVVEKRFPRGTRQGGGTEQKHVGGDRCLERKVERSRAECGLDDERLTNAGHREVRCEPAQ